MKRLNLRFPGIVMLNLLMMAWIHMPALPPLTAHAIEKDPSVLKAAADRVAEESSAAVVHIEVICREDVEFPFWCYEMTQLLEAPQKRTQKKTDWRNSGTGVLLDEQGHILTNYHIVGSATELQVSQKDGRKCRARLLGADPKTDLAVIQMLIPQALRPAVFADSDTADAGDRVVVIGYGNKPGQVVDRGIILKLPQAGNTDVYTLHDLIRTNIPVDSENTGGPVFNLQGEVLGVNSALMSRLSGLEDVGFAIPGNTAARIASILIENGEMDRGWLGVTVHDVTPYAEDAVNLQRPEGARITHLVKGGPADRAGLKPGDVVTAYGNESLSSGIQLQREVAATPPGKKVALTVFRNKKGRRLPVVIGNLKKTILDPSFYIMSHLGVAVRPVTSKEMEHYGLSSPQGVLVVGVYPSSPMDKVGIESTDVIMEVEGRPVRDPRQFMREIIRLRGKKQLIMLGLDHRTGRSGFVQVKLP